VEVHPEWAPLGAQRFKQLVEEGFYDNCKFFRVVPGFVVQWGMNGDPAVNAKYQGNKIQDDKPKKSNKRGTIVFATSGPNARTSQVFVNLKDNDTLDTRPDNFAPFGQIIQGMEDVIEKLTSEYGEAPSQQQQTIAQVGNTFLDERFPNLDYIIKATIVGAKEDSEKSTPAEPESQPAVPKEESKGEPKEDDKPAKEEGQ
jgi:cyclophilin family peptidyl-prolyl cis-trans isomerase